MIPVDSVLVNSCCQWIGDDSVTQIASSISDRELVLVCEERVPLTLPPERGPNARALEDGLRE